MILVTGGTGMLGAHLLLELINKSENVRAIIRDKSKLEKVKKIFSFYHSDPEKLIEKIEWVYADLLDAESLDEAFANVDKVYHAAAVVSFNPGDKYFMIDNNVRGTANIVNASLKFGIKKLCHVSSVSALGHAETNALADEDTFRNPKEHYSGYSISKFRSELEVWRGITEGLNAVIVNPSIILGPGDWKSGSPSIFGRIGKGLKFYTRGITGYVDVLDVVKSMILLMESEIHSEKFVVSAENLSYEEIFSKVAESLSVKKPFIYANSVLLGIAWRLEGLKSKLTGKAPLVTKQTALSAKKITRYSSQKLIKALNFEYISIANSIERIAKIYKTDCI
jgi:nucleoside-diphosphate-sugar epimerase